MSSELVVVPDSLIWDEALGKKFVINTKGHSGFVVLEGLALEVMEAVLQRRQTIHSLLGYLGWSHDWLDTYLHILRRLAQLELLWPGDGVRESVKEEMTSKSRAIYDLWLQTTDSCNLACGYCFVPKNPASMSISSMKAVIGKMSRDCVESGYDELRVKFAGGEPTLVWDRISEVISWVLGDPHEVCCDVSFAILTNGTILNQEMMGLASSGILNISVSMDGLGEDQDQQRPFADGSGSSRIVLNTVTQLAKKDVCAGILCVVGKKNIGNLVPLIEHAFSLGHFVRLGLCREDELTPTDLLTSTEELVEGFGNLFDWMETNIPEPSLYQCLRFGEVNFRMPKLRGCGAGISGASVNVDGTMSYCPSLTDFRQDIVEDVNSIRVLAHRLSDDFTKATVTTTDGCSSCEWRFICGNGCPMQNQKLYGDRHVASPRCELFKYALPRLGRLHAKQAILAATDDQIERR